MKKTILITGSSTGIGKATATYFAQQGWNVAATMRTPSKEKDLPNSPNVKLYTLDVMNEESIQVAITQVINDFGKVDVLFNNAGYALIGAFEAMSNEEILKQFNTNVFGVMNVTRALLPHFRSNNDGTIITTSSMGGRITFPIYSVYHATKFAIEGFMESLQFELKTFNIKVKNIEPGAIKTDFYERSLQLANKPGLTAYDKYVEVTNGNMLEQGRTAPGPEIVAKTVFNAATSNNYKLRYPVGAQGPLLLIIRWMLPLSWFTGIVKMVTEKGYKI